MTIDVQQGKGEEVCTEAIASLKMLLVVGQIVEYGLLNFLTTFWRAKNQSFPHRCMQGHQHVTSRPEVMQSTFCCAHSDCNASSKSCDPEEGMEEGQRKGSDLESEREEGKMKRS